MTARTCEVLCEDEWSPLQEVIVGRATHSYFPSEPQTHLASIMPAEHISQFRKGNPFPADIVRQADIELDGLATLLQSRGIKVHRPAVVDWGKVGGYTSAMPRDAFFVIGNTIIESCYAWKCRQNEVRLAYADILDQLDATGQYNIIRAPIPPNSVDLYNISVLNGPKWTINNSRPAFDVADFIRCGPFIVGQQSHVTNASGIEYLRGHLPPNYNLVLPEIDCPAAMHIDATFLPLRPGLAIFNPLYTSEDRLRKCKQLENWELVSIGHEPRTRSWPPLYMTSPEIRMNTLSLDERTVVVEEDDHEMIELFRCIGLDVITLPFKHVQCLGGSFHCATVDLRRASNFML